MVSRKVPPRLLLRERPPWGLTAAATFQPRPDIRAEGQRPLARPRVLIARNLPAQRRRKGAVMDGARVAAVVAAVAVLMAGLSTASAPTRASAPLVRASQVFYDAATASVVVGDAHALLRLDAATLAEAARAPLTDVNVGGAAGAPPSAGCLSRVSLWPL